MYNVQKINKDLYYIGASDRRLALFESVFPIPRGISYNSYLLCDEKTVLLDTVDNAVNCQFFENLEFVLGEKKLDYVIVNHMEPDHCATLSDLVRRYPEVKIVANKKTVGMIKQFFDFDVDSRLLEIAEGDTLVTGAHTLTFIMAPMVHWPEVMVTYDTTDKILFSADAFGTFGALSGNIFADDVNFKNEWLDDARRYYTNIVGKYGPQVLSLLKKTSDIKIEAICPLHGPIWRKDISWFIDKYYKWASYTPEENAVMIAYSSVYGNTQNAAEILGALLSERGVKNIAMYDVSVTHPSVIVSEAFRCSHLVFATTTYNAGIFVNMETVLLDIKAHNLKNRTVALIENGSWAPTAASLMKDILNQMKDMTILDAGLTIRSSLKDAQRTELCALADAIVNSIPKPEVIDHSKKIESSAIFSLSYGLYLLSAKDGEKDNGCIINTAMQVTDNPKRILVAVNKANLTHDMIIKTGKFNISVLTVDTPFSVFEHFGFSSGRDTDKFASCKEEVRTENGIIYLPKFNRAVISGEVISTEDCGTHTVFVADITEAKQLSDARPVTYEYYFEHIKPKKKPEQDKKTGYVCKICGYFYEGETLPDDYICPLCKHGAEDFEKVTS
ncbi:MAG: flavin reductase [Clostridia bacterium]|nr:flavin reductase [Clostridia bacterium]